MGVSPTQNSLKKLRGEGYLCEIVEKTIPKCFIKKDLFGFIDIVAIKGKETLGIQTTSSSNYSDRIKKILGHENLPNVIIAGWKIRVHGWKKVKNRWVCKEQQINKLNK